MTDKGRIVIDYAGVQVVDCRDNIRIVIKGEPPHGARWGLKDAGFKAMPDGAWERPASPDAVFKAQLIVNTFFRNGGADA